MRVSGLLGALPSHENPSWQGRLVDYLLSKVLNSRPVRMCYLQAPALVSPIGFAVRNLGDVEKKLLKQLVAVMKSGDEKNFSFDDKTGPVTPISLSTQKLSVAFFENCFS